MAPLKRRRTGGGTDTTAAAKDSCAHFSSALAFYAQQLRARAANGSSSSSKSATRDVERLERYCGSTSSSVTEPSSVCAEDVYECLSCAFSGVRERLSGPEAGGDENESTSSFMAHAILHDHPLGLLTRKQQLYCACCRDFIYPSALLEHRVSMGLSIKIHTHETTSASRSLSALSFWRKANKNLPPATPRRPSRRGLVNMGNTCYMNVVLQTFAHNALLQHYFLVAKGHGTTICRQTRKLQQQQEDALVATQAQTSSPSAAQQAPASTASLPICLGCDLSEFMATLAPATTLSQPPAASPPFVPHKIMEAFWSFAPAFIGSQQHDAHEFFLAFLGGLHAHTHPKVLEPGAMSPRFTPTGTSLCDCAVHQHYAGVLVSEVECALCDEVSSTFDPFLDLSLSLETLAEDAKASTSKGSQQQPQSPVLSLESLLTKFTAEEHLRGINRVYCRRCRAYANMNKRLRLHRLPNVLVVHIKRLDFHKQQKLSDFVQFPLRKLSLEEFRANNNSDSPEAEDDDDPVTPTGSGVSNDGSNEPDASLYDLAAVINHHGDSVQGGHYTAFIQSGTEGLSMGENDSNGSGDLRPQWFLFDDTHVTPATEAQVLQSQAYMLYYVRRRPRIIVS